MGEDNKWDEKNRIIIIIIITPLTKRERSQSLRGQFQCGRPPSVSLTHSLQLRDIYNSEQSKHAYIYIKTLTL